MALRKINLAYYVYFRDENGQRHTRALKTRDPVVAAEREKLFMAEINRRRFVKAFGSFFPDAADPVPVAPPPPTPGEGDHQRGGIALDKMWDVASKKRLLSPTHKIHWNRFLDAIKVKYADQVTSKMALEYLETHYSGGNGKSYNNVKSALNTIFRCCLVEAGLSVSPFAPIVNRRVTEIEHHRNLTAEEFERALAAAPEHFRLMMMLSRWTCQRLETCARMTPKMFDFKRKVFLIDPGKTKRFDKWVCCPIMPELETFIRPFIERCKRSDAAIYRAVSSMRTDDFSREFVKFLKRLGIRDTSEGKASFHSIRGTAITWYKEHGISGDALRYITGHTSDAVEDIYARPVEIISSIAKKAAENVDPIA